MIRKIRYRRRGCCRARRRVADRDRDPGSAKGGFHHGHAHHGHHGLAIAGACGVYRIYGVSYAYVDDCLRRTWVDTPWGPRRRLINVCD